MVLLCAYISVEFLQDRVAFCQGTGKIIISQRVTCLDCLARLEGRNTTPSGNYPSVEIPNQQNEMVWPVTSALPT